MGCLLWGLWERLTALYRHRNASLCGDLWHIYGKTILVLYIFICTFFTLWHSLFELPLQVGRIWLPDFLVVGLSRRGITKHGRLDGLSLTRPSAEGKKFIHDDVIKWKHFPRYWSFVRRIHRSPVNRDAIVPIETMLCSLWRHSNGVTIPCGNITYDNGMLLEGAALLSRPILTNHSVKSCSINTTANVLEMYKLSTSKLFVNDNVHKLQPFLSDWWFNIP